MAGECGAAGLLESKEPEPNGDVPRMWMCLKRMNERLEQGTL